MKTLFPLEDTPVFQKFLPEIERQGTNPKTNVWKVPYTISQLAYLVHSHYRYYGKFPSVIAGQLLEQYKPKSSDDWVLDNFCGSGTTLVEAKLRDVRSFGIDISWLSVLASNVKVRHISIDALESLHAKIIIQFRRYKQVEPDDDFSRKWFTPVAASDLLRLSRAIRKLDHQTPEFDFILVAFLAIIRRVSKAFDGEVRPHINRKKKERDVLQAFSKKIRDMSRDHIEFMELTKADTPSMSVIGNNLSLPKGLPEGNCYLAISHPPYLNSFNYAPVFSLEYFWGNDFENIYVDAENISFQKSELKAHPATESIVDQYFSHLKKCYEEIYRIQKRRGVLAVVIGDCTRNKKLIPVVDRTIELCKAVGYEVEEINYRTTHYGLGKYAYKHRADYHGEAEKKDGILIFKRK